MRLIIIFIFCTMLNISCAQTKSSKENVNVNKLNPCSETELFEVTKTFSKNIHKPEVHFTVEVPKCLKLNPAIPGKKSFVYAKIEKHDKNNVLEQMVSLGYIESTKKEYELEKESIGFLQQIRDLLVNTGYEFEEEELMSKKFDGKIHTLFQGIGTLKNNPNPEFQGCYYIKAVIVPNPYGNTNVMFYMIVRDDQNISHYQDFADRLDISKVWQSFKYIKD